MKEDSLENLEKKNEEFKKVEETPAQSGAPPSSEQEDRIKVPLGTCGMRMSLGEIQCACRSRY